MPEIAGYVIAGLVALAVTYFATGPISKIAVSIGAVDHPAERKIHLRPIPRLGGIAIFLGFVAALFFYCLWQRAGLAGAAVFPLSSEMVGFAFGAVAILALGIVDDIRELSPFVKLLGQTVAALFLVVFGVRMEFIGNPQGGLIYLGSAGVFLTVIWVVAFANIMNLIDGLDGLAAGVAAIASITFVIFSLETGQVQTAVIAVAVAGACLGFLRHNFNPAKVFMGDSGSMFLGFVLGAITVEGVMKSVAAIALLAPLVIMAVPILDAALAILRRYRNHQPVTVADSDHLHHRLLKRGLSQRQTVLMIYAWCIALSGFALSLKFMPAAQKYISIFFVLFVSVLFAEVSGFFGRNGSKGK